MTESVGPGVVPGPTPNPNTKELPMLCPPFKYVEITNPGALLDNASATTGEVDTLGFDYAVVVVQLGATDGGLTALQVTESDTTGSGHTAVTGLVYGTSTNTADATSTLPTASSDDQALAFFIDLRARKRYLDLDITAPNTTSGAYVSAFAILFKSNIAPNTASEWGFDQVLRV
jgi:hypothetical protein